MTAVKAKTAPKSRAAAHVPLTFLCEPQDLIRLPQPELVLVCDDGCGARFADPHAADFADLKGRAADHGWLLDGWRLCPACAPGWFGRGQLAPESQSAPGHEAVAEDQAWQQSENVAAVPLDPSGPEAADIPDQAADSGDPPSAAGPGPEGQFSSELDPDDEARFAIAFGDDDDDATSETSAAGAGLGSPPAAQADAPGPEADPAAPGPGAPDEVPGFPDRDGEHETALDQADGEASS